MLKTINMRHFVGITLIFLICCSCKHQDQLGKVNFNYSLPFKINDSVIENDNPTSSLRFKEYQDTVVLRFMKEFSKDDISLSVGSLFYKDCEGITTDMSIGYADAVGIAKNTFRHSMIIIKLRGIKYTIPFKEEYHFIDIYIDEKNDLQVEYNNTIWVLS